VFYEGPLNTDVIVSHMLYTPHHFSTQLIQLGSDTMNVVHWAPEIWQCIYIHRNEPWALF